MGIIGWIVLGLIAGAIARALHRGDEPTGVLATLLVGILGAMLGGLLASAVGVGSISSFFSIGTWLLAIGGAFALLVLYDAASSAGSGVRRRGAAPGV
ncbi:MAG TPA: GlsB/YeaQ/YmgE family stress response membrane protein [Baekduia sp.]|nr:GlsB/YeaQ/YmgE family stress response membrane protein [Baekduia sp.]